MTSGSIVRTTLLRGLMVRSSLPIRHLEYPMKTGNWNSAVFSGAIRIVHSHFFLMGLIIPTELHYRRMSQNYTLTTLLPDKYFSLICLRTDPLRIRLYLRLLEKEMIQVQRTE